MVEMVRYEAARKALAAACRVDEVKDVRDKALAMQAYAKQAQDTELMENATDIRLRAERRAGELLREMVKNPGEAGPGRGNKNPLLKKKGVLSVPKLSDLGITYKQSSHWQKVAAMPEAKFEAHLAMTKEKMNKTTVKTSRKAKPRAERSPKAVAREERIRTLVDAGFSRAEIIAEMGLGGRFIDAGMEHNIIADEAAAKIDPATLSLTAQQKLDLAIKQATRRLEAEIEKRVYEDNLHWIQQMLDMYNTNAKQHEALLRSRTKGIMSRADYRSILSCLHPDRVQDEELKKRYEHAFNLFTKLEKSVLSEQDSPTTTSGLPKTAAEFLKRKAEYTARRAANRAAKHSGVQVR